MAKSKKVKLRQATPEEEAWCEKLNHEDRVKALRDWRTKLLQMREQIDVLVDSIELFELTLV